MDYFELARGSSTIRLHKSKNLIGLRTHSPNDFRLAVSNLGPAIQWQDTEKYLGGFRLCSVNAEVGAEQVLDRLRESDLVDTGSHVFHQPESDVSYVPTGKIMIRFHPGIRSEDMQALFDKYNLKIVESRIKKTEINEYDQETHIVSVTAKSMNPLKVADALQKEEKNLVELAEPDLSTSSKLFDFNMPTDPMLIDQWHLSNSGKQYNTTVGLKVGADARVVNGWSNLGGLGSGDCILAIIDDGVDITHPDLSGLGKIVAPWDFQTGTNDPNPKTFTPATGDRHGTACAGVALADANGVGTVGAAPYCKLMPVRWSENLNDDSIEKWFDYVTANGAWIVNCSWGPQEKNYGLSTRQTEAIANCAAKGRNGLGCVIVFAAGNDSMDINDPAGGTVNGFAIHPDVIAVAASNSRDETADYSNYGKEIFITAPSSGKGGRGILTTDVLGNFTYEGQTYPKGSGQNGYYNNFGGTSSAAPLVSGVCALILSKRPQFTVADVKQAIQLHARQIGDPESYTGGRSQVFGFGCINAEDILKHI